MSNATLRWNSNYVETSDKKISLGKHFAKKISIFSLDKKVARKSKKHK